MKDASAGLLNELLHGILAGAAVHLGEHAECLIADGFVADVGIQSICGEVADGSDGNALR